MNNVFYKDQIKMLAEYYIEDWYEEKMYELYKFKHPVEYGMFLNPPRQTGASTAIKELASKYKSLIILPSHNMGIEYKRDGFSSSLHIAGEENSLGLAPIAECPYVIFVDVFSMIGNTNLLRTLESIYARIHTGRVNKKLIPIVGFG